MQIGHLTLSKLRVLAGGNSTSASEGSTPTPDRDTTSQQSSEVSLACDAAAPSGSDYVAVAADELDDLLGEATD